MSPHAASEARPSEISHTPGPWTQDQTSVHSADMMTVRVADCASPRRRAGAHLPANEILSYAECDANARLIAAAPALKNGCNALLGLLQLVCGRDDIPPAIKNVLENNHRVAEAQNAVALATGAQS